MLRKIIIVCPENSKAEQPAQGHGEKRMSPDIIGNQNMEEWKMGSDMGTPCCVDNHGLPTWKDNLLLCLGRVTES
ncbi:hypothetical protein NC651_010391 [Populus alba x Populus x berolinensis]|nr:hypothetical protein NC651_010391 [Populus alba x Populus x berolinensis]